MAKLTKQKSIYPLAYKLPMPIGEPFFILFSPGKTNWVIRKTQCIHVLTHKQHAQTLQWEIVVEYLDKKPQGSKHFPTRIFSHNLSITKLRFYLTRAKAKKAALSYVLEVLEENQKKATEKLEAAKKELGKVAEKPAAKGKKAKKTPKPKEFKFEKIDV